MKIINLAIGCDNMPLIDEDNRIIDHQLVDLVKSNFSFSKGLISCKNGKSYLLWRKDEIESWWRFFEETMDSSLGRKLANSSCDEEELLLGIEDFTPAGLFKRSKKIHYLLNRWQKFGWGSPDFKTMSINQSGLSPLFSGLFQASLEWLEQNRYKLTWQDSSADRINLNVEKTNFQIAKPENNLTNIEFRDPLELDIENEWRIDGQRYHLLSSGIFDRLRTSCLGFTANISEDERSGWPSIDDVSLSMAIASRKNFISGEEIFLAADEDGWVSSICAIFSNKGYGEPIKAEYIDKNGGVEIMFSETTNSPLLLGLLSAAWSRCEGRPAKVECDIDKKPLKIRISSKQKIA